MAAGTYDFQAALRSRLGQIDSLGTQQTTWDQLQNAKRRSAQLTAESQQMYAAQIQGQNSIPQGRFTPGSQGAAPQYQGQAAPQYQGQSGMAGAGNGGFQNFLNAIKAKESGGNYNAKNKMSGAMGAYQVMPSNLGGNKSGWDYEALGYDVSAAQYMASPEIQEKVSSYKLNQYYQKYGPSGASIAWYAGPGAADRYANSGKVSGRTEAGGYPSQSAYMQAIMNRMGR